MLNIFRLVGLAIFGVVVASLAGLDHIESASWYVLCISLLLGVGLYSSTFGIDLAEARKHVKIIFAAITVGVLMKAVIIGGSLALITQNPYYLILGVIVAQIDPLSVGALMQGSRLSARAKSILASWASFDDPITVIMSLYVPIIIAQVSGLDVIPLPESASSGSGLVGYLGELGINLGYAAAILMIWMLIRQFATRIAAVAAWLVSFIAYLVAASALSVAIYYFWMLSVATMGLFLRPPIEKLIDKAANIALYIATILLGMLLIDGVNIGVGVGLGVATFTSQIIVGFLLTRRLDRRDRIHIAFAQQNGITAIILGLLFEPVYPGTIAIIAPAIFTINIIHASTNWLIDTRLSKTD